MSERHTLESWKEISAHLGRDQRTCRRWEIELGLPIHRLDRSSRARVYAYADELDAWLKEKLESRAVRAGLKRWQRIAVAVALTGLSGLAVFLLALRPALAPRERIQVAVMYAVNNSGDKGLDDYYRWQIPYYLSMDLAQSKYLRIVPQDRLMQVLQDLDRLGEERPLSNTLDRIAEAARVDYFILPGFTQTDAGVVINLTVRKAGAEEAIGRTVTVQGKGVEDLLPLVADASEKVKPRLSLTAGKIASDAKPDLGRITTASPEAVRSYVDGQLAYVRGDYAGALSHLELAVKADPDFALAYLWISINAQYLGDYGRFRENLQKALSLSDRVGERDRYLIRANAAYALEKSPAHAIESYEKLLEIDPEDVEARISLGAIYRNLEEWDRALAQFDRARQVDPKNVFAQENVVFIFTALGRYERAIGLCEGYQAGSPDLAFYARQLPLLYLIQGRYEQAAEELRRSLESPLPDEIDVLWLEGAIDQLRGDLAAALGVFENLRQRGEAGDAGFDMRGRAWSTPVLVQRGSYGLARKNLIEGIELAKNHGRLGEEMDLRRGLSYLEVQCGRPEAALQALEPVRDPYQDEIIRGSQKNVLHALGLATVAAGRIDEAKTIAEDLRQAVDRAGYPKEARRYEHLLGSIALAEGRAGEAILRFKTAVSLLAAQREHGDLHALFLDGLARAYEASGDFEQALETYRAIQALTTGRILWGDIYAKSFYRLGRICLLMGKPWEAADHFRTFLELWKDADDGLKEIDDARRQLTAIGAR